MNVNYDAVIVGAGPAGCTLARYLSNKFNVLLIDKSEFPREKPCGGLLVPESQRFIKQLEPLGFIFSKPKKLELKLINWDDGSEFKVKREYVNVVRRKFDHWLLDLVPDKVEILKKTELLDFYEGADGLNVAVSSEGKTQVIKTKYLIGADGAASAVRKRISDHRIPTYLAIQESLEGVTIKDAYFIYDSTLTDFYSWVIPKGDHLVVGSAFPMNNGNVRDKFDKFKSSLSKNLGFSGDYENRESALILRPGSTDDIILGKNRVLLIGEAAGLISPSTGEGISFALRSGYVCAEALNNSRDVLNQYKKSCGLLLDEISDKIVKSGALSERKKRNAVLGNWTGLSEHALRDPMLEIWSK